MSQFSHATAFDCTNDGRRDAEGQQISPGRRVTLRRFDIFPIKHQRMRGYGFAILWLWMTVSGDGRRGRHRISCSAAATRLMIANACGAQNLDIG